MNKVGLAKMLGLELASWNAVCKWEIKELLEHDWQTIEWVFNADVVVMVEQVDLEKDKLDIKLSDLEKDADVKVCIKQVEDLLWERAADEYLSKIQALVETIKV